MTLRCEQCGHDNDSRYRFCGMCGAKLPPPPREAEAAEVQAEPFPPKSSVKRVSGPSFLGLADEPSDPISYLLEDDPASTGAGRYVVLMILLVGVAAAGWHWRQDLRALAWRFAGGPPASQSQQTSGLAPAPAAASSSETQTAPSATPAVESPAAAGGSGQAAPASASGTNGAPPTAQPVPATNQAATAAAPNSASSEPPPSPDSSAPQQTSPPAGAAPVNNAQPADASTKSAASADDTEDSQETPATPKPKAAVKAAKSSSEQEPPASESDALETQGEKYLYGSGVRANCSLAQKSLLAAAERSNTRAQSVLGTMYATGHCASRDLPLAYRWFARALHQEPNNSRIQDDLKVLWSQMSADERQLALKTEH